MEDRSLSTPHLFNIDSGAIYVDTVQAFTMRGQTRFIDNSAWTGFGGGIYLSSGQWMIVELATFVLNKAFWGGAVATFSSGGQLNPLDYGGCIFTNNSASEDGGGLYSVASYDKIYDVQMSDNFAGRYCAEGEA